MTNNLRVGSNISKTHSLTLREKKILIIISSASVNQDIYHLEKRKNQGNFQTK